MAQEPGKVIILCSGEKSPESHSSFELREEKDIFLIQHTYSK